MHNYSMSPGTTPAIQINLPSSNNNNKKKGKKNEIGSTKHAYSEDPQTPPTSGQSTLQLSSAIVDSALTHHSAFCFSIARPDPFCPSKKFQGREKPVK